MLSSWLAFFSPGQYCIWWLFCYYGSTFWHGICTLDWVFSSESSNGKLNNFRGHLANNASCRCVKPPFIPRNENVNSDHGIQNYPVPAFFNKLDSVTGCQEMPVSCILEIQKFWMFWSYYFPFLVDISLLVTLLGFSLLEDNIKSIFVPNSWYISLETLLVMAYVVIFSALNRSMIS